jgi:O-antigen/teichoic acid export membrane protein
MTDPPHDPQGSSTPSEETADINVAAVAIRGTAYSYGASLITWTSGTARLLLLMRLLRPDDFGVAAQALIFLGLAMQLRGLGIDQAFIQDHKTDRNSTSTFFTMKVGLLVVSLGLLLAVMPLIGGWYPDMPLLGSVLLAFAAVEPVRALNDIRGNIIRKQLGFRRLALADIVGSIAATVAAPFAAWYGWGVWSLVVERASGSLARALVVWTAPSVQRTRLGWDKTLARQYLTFGLSIWIGRNLAYIINRFDDFWIGRVLGQTALGLYSRAYTLASYPRQVVAAPILTVFLPTYARLQDDQLRLSRAFFRATSLMVRLSGWVSLVLVLAAPELIELGPGPQWLPALRAFQLMIVYVVLTPLNMGAINLLISTGNPDIIIRIRAVQAVVFIPAVVGFAALFADIIGVALAADLVAFCGTLLFFYQVRRIVDFSPHALWTWPVFSMLITGGVTLVLEAAWVIDSIWLSLFAKIALITSMYLGLLWLTERNQLYTGLQMIRGIIAPVLSRILGRTRT